MVSNDWVVMFILTTGHLILNMWVNNGHLDVGLVTCIHGHLGINDSR